MKKIKQKQTDQISFYFYKEKWLLVIITITGIFYNLGMVAGPWFEGRMVQALCDILTLKKQPSQMLFLVLCYIITICFVQFMRYGKRLYVRKFANNINKQMKMTLFENMIYQKKTKQLLQTFGKIPCLPSTKSFLCLERFLLSVLAAKMYLAMVGQPGMSLHLQHFSPVIKSWH